MRFNCGPTYAERAKAWCERRQNWHSWFAWRPVRIDGNRCVWMERIERKETVMGMHEPYWKFEYRLPKPQP